eukprot:scaffold21797_cov20-Prasinocladus_malaysianus.AAC.1
MNKEERPMTRVAAPPWRYLMSTASLRSLRLRASDEMFVVPFRARRVAGDGMLQASPKGRSQASATIATTRCWKVASRSVRYIATS